MKQARDFTPALASPDQGYSASPQVRRITLWQIVLAATDSEDRL
jgi:hypothetical protein